MEKTRSMEEETRTLREEKMREEKKFSAETSRINAELQQKVVTIFMRGGDVDMWAIKTRDFEKKLDRLEAELKAKEAQLKDAENKGEEARCEIDKMKEICSKVDELQKLVRSS
eukprot:760076-Hanusia_phi.AAC.2